MLLEYSNYADVALEEDAKVLADYGSNNLAINLTPGSVPPH